MPDPDEVYELPDEDMCEVPGSRLRELADKAAVLETVLAEEREKYERLREALRDLAAAAGVVRETSLTVSESWNSGLDVALKQARAALASTGSEE